MDGWEDVQDRKRLMLVEVVNPLGPEERSILAKVLDLEKQFRTMKTPGHLVTDPLRKFIQQEIK